MPFARPRRSLLFVPADDPRKLRKAVTLPVDGVILELEDGVAPERKAVARAHVTAGLRELDFGPRERLVRVNAIGTEHHARDLAETIDARPDAYVVPKVESAEDVQRVCRWLDAAEAERGWPRGGIRLLVLIETARGVLKLRDIAAADERLDALIFGAEDLAGSIGAVRSREGWEVFHARSALVIGAAAHDLQAIDMVFTDVTDPAGLEAEATFGRRLGYAGKTVIHPGQVDIVNRAFSPTAAEIAHARRLIEGFDRAGGGAFALDGKMIDMPVIRQARRVLALAELTTPPDARA